MTKNPKKQIVHHKLHLRIRHNEPEQVQFRSKIQRQLNT